MWGQVTDNARCQRASFSAPFIRHRSIECDVRRVDIVKIGPQEQLSKFGIVVTRMSACARLRRASDLAVCQHAGNCWYRFNACTVSRLHQNHRREWRHRSLFIRKTETSPYPGPLTQAWGQASYTPTFPPTNGCDRARTGYMAEGSGLRQTQQLINILSVWETHIRLREAEVLCRTRVLLVDGEHVGHWLASDRRSDANRHIRIIRLWPL